MVLLKEVIRARKSNIVWSDWEQGPVPASKFPTKRPRKLKYSPEWAWRIIQFNALSESFRVLITLNEDKGKFSARLGIEKNRLIAILCDYELHKSHKDWHCHFTQKPVEEVEAGYLRDKHSMRYFPSGGSNQPNTVGFSVNKVIATEVTGRRYRIELPPQRELDL